MTSPVFSATPPEPGGNTESWCSEIVRTDGSPANAACVPLPWWASQSTIATRSTPRARAWAAASAALASRQKPIPRSASAWWPGGRTNT